MTVQAAAQTLTLACQGTATDISMPVDGEPEPASMGIIINLTAQTVAGLDFPLKITAVDEMTVSFRDSKNTDITSWSISGSINRVTGDMKAVSIKMNKKTFISVDVAYFLKCKPAQRMF